MNIEKERELFEDWHFKEHYIESADKNFLYERFDGNLEYISHEVQYAWKAWLASRNRDGYVLAPLEPTPKMIDSTWDYDEDIHKMSHNSRNEFIYKAMIGACDE